MENAEPANRRWKLSPEILAQIFAHLSVRDKIRAAQVCVAWRNAVYLPALWQGVVVKLRLDTKPDDNVIASLAERRIGDVVVGKLDGDHLRDVVEGNKSMEKIAFDSCSQMTDQMLFSSFITERQNFKSLSFLYCGLITDVAISLIAANLKNLIDLSLVDCNQLTDKSLLLISMGLKNLKSLRLVGCNSISDDGIGYLANVDRYNAGSQLQLESVTICCDNLTDLSLSYIGTGQKCLTHFVLRPSDIMTDYGMKSLSEMAQLSHLKINRSYLDGDWFGHLSTGNWKVSTLELFDDTISNEGMTILAGLPHLKCLSLKSCSEINNECIQYLVKLGSKITQLTIDNCERFTDEGLRFVSMMPHLLKLELLLCRHISNRGLDHLVEGGSKVQELKVFVCDLGPEALRIIASGLFHLQRLSLQPHYMNGQGLRLAAITLVNLKSLLVDGKELIGELRRLRLTPVQTV